MAKKSSRMRRLLSGVLSAVMLATLVPSTAFAIGRTDTGSFLTGPYLMTPKTNGMVVVWELDKPMKSTITYGTSDADKKTLEVPVEEGEKFKGQHHIVTEEYFAVLRWHRCKVSVQFQVV